ncbi:MAG: Aminoacyl-tRNA hydrolase, peptidyl-tRNA hydrolase, family [Parcubacteria group bacterium]|nr:Aminoacyl-tRNA hydrolase, peptidyl-tRNA hydrolase, family [Parcubacteria group bacterium]
MYIVVGLGNPGEEYARTRHNTGRMAAALLAEKGVDGVKVINPDTFMNKTGPFVAKFVKSEKAAEKLVVIYDDLDLPMGAMKISFNRSSGGHRGVESIIKALGTEKFIRVRIGISPVTPGGKLKKPLGEEKVEKHILGEFKPAEMEILNKVFKNAVTAVGTIAEKGLSIAMTQFNGS